MRIELVSTGNELLIGKTINTHAHTIAQYLAPFNQTLYRDTTVQDHAEDMKDAISSALARSDMVFCTGGLGPTEDDITREIVADITGAALQFHQPSLDQIEQFCQAGGRDFNDARKRQALVLDNAEVFLNPVGSAPGEYIAYQSKHIFLLPGPPNELRALLEQCIRPKLETILPAGDNLMEIFQVASAEGDIVGLFQAAKLGECGLDIAYCASPFGVEVRISGTNDPERLAAAVVRAKAALGDAVFSDGRVPMEQVVGDLMIKTGFTLSVAESCTGGLLGSRITDAPGSSRYFKGGIICYSNDVKMDQLDVSERDLETFGAVSEQVVRQMAEGVRKKFGADIGIGISGIAGPDGGTPTKPVGLVFMAVVDHAGMQTAWHVFRTERKLVRQLATHYVLNMLRLRLLRNV